MKTETEALQLERRVEGLRERARHDFSFWKARFLEFEKQQRDTAVTGFLEGNMHAWSCVLAAFGEPVSCACAACDYFNFGASR